MTKKVKEVTTPETIEVRIVEYFNTMVVRDSITLTISDYPELQGKTEEEIKDYIKSNYGDMNSSIEDMSLYDELIEQEVTREKITGEENEIKFE